jgi:hypothetical protein
MNPDIPQNPKPQRGEIIKLPPDLLPCLEKFYDHELSKAIVPALKQYIAQNPPLNEEIGYYRQALSQVITQLNINKGLVLIGNNIYSVVNQRKNIRDIVQQFYTSKAYADDDNIIIPYKSNIRGLELKQFSFSITDRYLYIDLSTCDISKGQMRNINLSHGNFRDTIAQNTDFSNSLLAYANFKGADIQGANFTGSMLQNGNWDSNADFSNALVNSFTKDLKGNSFVEGQNKEFSSHLIWDNTSDITPS